MHLKAFTTALLLSGALAAPAARAQQPPAGSFGFVAFTAGVPSTTTPLDALMAINLNGVPNPFPAGGPASPALAVNIPLNAGGIQLVAARSQQRRGMQAPREAEIAPVFNAGNPFPAIFIPAEDQQGFGYVTSVDFRSGFPATNTTPLPLHGHGVPYEILRHSTLPYVYYTTTNLLGLLDVVEVNYSTVNAPVITARYTVGGPLPAFGGPPTGYATKLTEVNPGTLAIPFAGGVDIVSVPGLVHVAINPTPVGFTVGTNVAVWSGYYGYDLICGLQDANPSVSQHGYMSINSTVPGGSSFPVTNPFGTVGPGGTGLPWRFAAGFYDIAITPSTASGPATATFLLDNPNGFGTSTNTLVATITQNQFFTTTINTIAQGSVFGNPEVMANAPGSVVFMVSSSAGPDFVGAVWPSVPALAPVVMSMMGTVDPATVDRPLALPGGTDFALPASAAPPFGIELFTVGLGTLVPNGLPISTMSPASGLPNVVTGGLLGSQAVYMQGFTASDVAVAGFPFSLTPLPVMSAPLTTPSRVTGLLHPVPLLPSTQPTFGARQAMLNYANGLTTDVRLLYPVTSNGGSQIDVFSPSTVPTSGQWRHPQNLMLTSELYCF